MKRLLNDPLLHFLPAGLALFILFEVVSRETPSDDEQTIVVNRDALLTFLQYRSRVGTVANYRVIERVTGFWA